MPAVKFQLGPHAAAVEARLARWREEGFVRRMGEKDPTLWVEEPVPELADRLGWLTLPADMEREAAALAGFGQEIRAEGVRHAVVLGMGGSSLAPEVFARTFGPADGFPELAVLDSTHPEAVLGLAERLDPARTLFVVSSKSGTTTETLAFFHFFWQRAAAAVADPGRRFVAVTDPGSRLEALARERGFRAVFPGPPEVGGRYSALTFFGLVPAALLGLDVGRLLASGREVLQTSGGLELGAALGELALAGRDKVTFWTDARLASFPDWIEQLVAESTGKRGQGILPVVGEAPGEPISYGPDRVFVALIEDGDRFDAALAAVSQAGHPTVRLALADPHELGGEMVRWEIATAAACSVLRVNPFDQPDVQLAKEMATRAMQEAGPESGEPDDATPAADGPALAAALDAWLERAGPRDYLGIHAYLPPSERTSAALAVIQAALRHRSGLAVTVGYGPRFLHSTGQLHKGGPSACRFLQLVDTPAADAAVPEAGYSFAALLRAQAEGDCRALRQRGRAVLRVHLGRDREAGLAQLLSAGAW